MNRRKFVGLGTTSLATALTCLHLTKAEGQNLQIPPTNIPTVVPEHKDITKPYVNDESKCKTKTRILRISITPDHTFEVTSIREDPKKPDYDGILTDDQIKTRIKDSNTLNNSERKINALQEKHIHTPFDLHFISCTKIVFYLDVKTWKFDNFCKDDPRTYPFFIKDKRDVGQPYDSYDEFRELHRIDCKTISIFNNFLFHTIPSGEPPEQRSNLYNISKVDRMLVKNGSSVKWVKPYKHYFGLRMKINGGKSELPDDETAEYITPIEIDPEVGNGGNCFVIC